MEAWFSDVRYALRQLRKSPAFTLSAVLTLALGIGANTVVFLVLYGAVLRSLPFPESGRLVQIDRSFPDYPENEAQAPTKFLYFQRVNHTLAAAAAIDMIPSHVSLLQGDSAVPLDALHVTADFFRVFAMEPHVGRGFNPEEDRPSAADVAVISDALWKQRFGGSGSVLGQQIVLGSQPYTVVGVADPRFRLDAKADIWIPLHVAEDGNERSNIYRVVARMKGGVSRAQVADDLKSALRQMKDVYPKLWEAQESVTVLDLHAAMVGQIKPALLIMASSVTLVLLIVCANVLSLLLTRALARRREMSLRAALGASGWHVFRQLLVENLVLCGLGAAVALLLARAAEPLLLSMSPLQLPEFSTGNVTGAAVLFAACLTLLCSSIFSVVPMRESRRARLNEALRMNNGNVTTAKNLTQKVLVGGEVAVSLMLLVGAGLLLASFWRLMRTPAGFDSRNALTFKTVFNGAESSSTAAMARRYDDLISRMAALPGVQSAAAAVSLPTELTPDLPFDVVGRPPQAPHGEGDEYYLPVTAKYFEALGIPLKAGRAFTAGDRTGSAGVAIVNQLFADRYFPGQNAIGQHILIGRVMGPSFSDAPREIVGVVGNTKQQGLNSPDRAILFVPLMQVPDAVTAMTNQLTATSWIVRTKGADADVPGELRRVFMSASRTPLLSVMGMQQVVETSVGRQRFLMALLLAFGAISLLLGAAGLYGVMSYAVARQTRDIGVRMAIGAARSDILRMVLKEAVLLLTAGIVAGLVASIAGARILSSLLYGIGPRDPLTIFSMSALLFLTGLFAAWWPARRAAAIEPMEALRNE